MTSPWHAKMLQRPCSTPLCSQPSCFLQENRELLQAPSGRCFEGSCVLAGCLGRASTCVGAKMRVSRQRQAPGLTGATAGRVRGALLRGASLARFVEPFGTLQSAVLLSRCEGKGRFWSSRPSLHD